MQRWVAAAQPDRLPRIAAALLAAALTGGLLAALRPEARRVGSEALPVVVTYFRLVPLVMKSETRLTAPKQTGPIAGRTEQRPPRLRAPSAPSQLAPQAAVVVSSPTMTAPSAQAPLVSPSVPSTGRDLPTERGASAPLTLDAAAVRAAVESAKSPMRRMADASGAYFGDETVSAQQGLARSVAGAAKKDCLEPNDNGSLLSAIVLPYMYISGKCK